MNYSRDLLRNYNADASIIDCSYGKIRENLLALNAYDGNQLENKLLNPHHHHHRNELIAHSFEFAKPLIPEKFEHWISTLLILNGYQIYRIKGILHLKGESRKIIFQSVRSNSQINIGSQWMEGEIKKSKIVFIGNNIKRIALEKGLNSCLK